MEFTYSEDCISDLHKEVYGFRPSESFWQEWNESTPGVKQKIWDEYCDANERQMKEDQAREAQAVEDFKNEVASVIELGACNYRTAIRWMAESEPFYTTQCVEHWVWNQGILFTDYGRKLVQDLTSVVKFEESAW
jgi:hypothetical protein